MELHSIVIAFDDSTTITKLIVEIIILRCQIRITSKNLLHVFNGSLRLFAASVEPCVHFGVAQHMFLGYCSS